MKLLDIVVLKKDLPEKGLCKGDMGTIVEIYDTSHYEIEFLKANGRTLSLITLPPSALRNIKHNDIVSVRELKSMAA